MSLSPVAAENTTVASVRVTASKLTVELRDGRTVSVPLRWYPRLVDGTPAERRRWELIGPGIGIHWPSLDEDISVEALLLGRGSNESAASLQRWRATRRQHVRKRRVPSRSGTIKRPSGRS